MILGKNLILTVGDDSRGLAASKSCDLSIDTDFIEVCSPVNGSWKEYLPTINSWICRYVSSNTIRSQSIAQEARQ